MKLQYGKKSTTEVKDNKLFRRTKTIVAGEVVLPMRLETEENIEVSSRKEQDEVYIDFADEEERLRESGRLIDSGISIKRTPNATKKGTWYVVKKFTVLDNGFDE